MKAHDGQMGPASPARPSSQGHCAERDCEWPQHGTALNCFFDNPQGVHRSPQHGTLPGTLEGTWLWPRPQPHMGSALHTALVVGSPGHAKPHGVCGIPSVHSPPAHPVPKGIRETLLSCMAPRWHAQSWGMQDPRAHRDPSTVCTVPQHGSAPSYPGTGRHVRAHPSQEEEPREPALN